MAKDASHQDTDPVDRIVAQWRSVRPDLDPSAKEITGRMIRIADAFHRRFEAGFAPLGLSGGQFGVLAALRRVGKPYELTPTDLAREQMMTSGGMTPVIDSLERGGMVERTPNPSDRRGRLVKLTPAGLALIDRAMETHAATERELVGGLSTADQAKLVKLL